MGLELRPVADAGAMGEYMAGKPVPSDTDECGSCQVPECAPPPHQVPRSAPGQAELSLRLQYSSVRAGHRDISESRVRTEVNGPDTRGTDWHCWVPGQAGLTLDHGRVGA